MRTVLGVEGEADPLRSGKAKQGVLSVFPYLCGVPGAVKKPEGRVRPPVGVSGPLRFRAPLWL